MIKATSFGSGGFWQSRRVFVTGATGLVGSWLIKELLAQGASVVALVRDADPQSELLRSNDIQKISVVNGRLEDYFTLERAINENQVDTVFHLGAQPLVGVAFRSPLQTYETNIRGTYNLLEACRVHKHFVNRIVIASSDKAYGTQPSLPYTEEMSLQGQHPYDVSKSCTDLLAQAAYHSYNLPLAIARCGNIYGGGDLNWSRIVPGTIRSLLNEERPIIRSDGTFVRDYIFVKDVIHAYLRLAEELDRAEIKGQAINFSPSRPLSVLEMVNEVQKTMGGKKIPPDIQNNATAEIHSQYLSAEKAVRLLNWQPKYSLKEALTETVEWYRKFLEGAND
jgi:CDP-glucose 4,6-dehydratase